MIRPVFGDVNTATSELLPEHKSAASRHLKIYPNPATTHFTVEWDSAAERLQALMIVNAHSGQIVKTIRDVEYSSVIEVDNLAAGAYIIMSPSTGENAKLLIIK
jgi:hypothetical protein